MRSPPGFLGGWGLSHVPGTMRPKGKGPQVVAPESAAGKRVPRLATGKMGAASFVSPYKPFKKPGFCTNVGVEECFSWRIL